MAKSKFYVVWKGIQPGIYHTWTECKMQIEGYADARYKSFATLPEAEKAFSENPWKHVGKTKNSKQQKIISSIEIVKNSISVDAACSGNPGLMEYRGVYTGDGVEIFHVGPMPQGTNNIGEFLAIVHALALLKQKSSNMAIYSDSVNAMKWVEKKKCNTKLEKTQVNQPIFDLIARAEKWLIENEWETPILKWETDSWGEIPADFGRK